MKSKAKRRFFVSVMLFIVMGLTAQISTPVGEYQGGGSKDTAHFVDKPSMHVHEQTTVIPEKKTGKNNQTAPATNTSGQGYDSTQRATGQNPSPTDTVGNLNSSEINGGASNTSMEGTTSLTTVSSGGNDLAYIYAALSAFGIGALIGLFLISTIFRNKKSPVWVAVLHGALGFLGIALLIVYSVSFPGPILAIVLFAVAATGGLMVFYKDINNQPIPKWLAVTHGIVAVAGIITLVVFAVK